MKKLVALILVIVTVFTLGACTKYKSSYSATMLVRSEGRNGCEVRFNSLRGTLVMNTTVTVVEAGDALHYEASLEDGEMTVYYDISGTKELLFTIRGGMKLEGEGPLVNQKDKITVIIETNGTARGGDIDIEVD